MSDALWTRISIVLNAVDQAPPANARALLDAMIYLALSGGDWAELPAAYPPTSEVAAGAVRWRRLGLFERLEPELPVRLDLP
jgi:transposase